MALIKTKGLTIKAGREWIVCTEDPEVTAPLEMRGWGWVPVPDLEAAGGIIGPRATRLEVQLMSDQQRDYHVDLLHRHQEGSARKFAAKAIVRQVVDFDEDGRRSVHKGSSAAAWVDKLGTHERLLLDALADLGVKWTMGKEPDRKEWRRGFLLPAELEALELELEEKARAAGEEPPTGPKSGSV